jgi:phosphoribosyl-AMP cyclohydrolase
MPDSPAPLFAPRGKPEEIEEGASFQPKFDAGGLIPAIVTEATSGEVLMFAWMNGEALARTLETRSAHFWSRSRRALWRKGEESGNTLEVVELRTDCDQDVVWLRVRVSGRGLVCHTGRRGCFYRAVRLGKPAAESGLEPSAK